MTAATTDSTGAVAPAEEEPGPGEVWTARAVTPVLATVPAPAPVVAPYLGLVASVLCALGGGWLLLAPYALDIRHGAAKLPRAAAVELETGAAIVAVALLSAFFFSAALFSRLRPRVDLADFEAETDQPDTESEAETEPEAAAEAEPESETEPEPLTPSTAASDSSSALRDMLTPLVAALAADLRSQDQGSRHHAGPGRGSQPGERGDLRRPQES